MPGAVAEVPGEVRERRPGGRRHRHRDTNSSLPGFLGVAVIVPNVIVSDSHRHAAAATSVPRREAGVRVHALEAEAHRERAVEELLPLLVLRGPARTSGRHAMPVVVAVDLLRARTAASSCPPPRTCRCPASASVTSIERLVAGAVAARAQVDPQPRHRALARRPSAAAPRPCRTRCRRQYLQRRGSRGTAATGRGSATRTSVLLSVASAMFWPVVQSLPPLSSHSDSAFWSRGREAARVEAVVVPREDHHGLVAVQRR